MPDIKKLRFSPMSTRRTSTAGRVCMSSTWAASYLVWCPSVYESFGIINLEAMACETAVVASAVGGIPEVVVPGETGLLVELELKPGSFDPVDPAGFSRALAEGINRVALDSPLREMFECNGRRRVEDHFSWTAIARQTLDLYQSLQV